MSLVKNIALPFYIYLVKKTEEASKQITLFALVMMVNFPLFGLLWKINHFQFNQEFFLRMLATILCLSLASHSFWSSSMLRILPILWYLTLFICLPFFFTYLTLLNNVATLWLMNSVSAVFFLLLVTNVLDALVLLCLGSACGFFVFYLGGQDLTYIPGDISLFSLAVTFVAAVIIGSLFARDRELLHANRISDLRILAASLAHDLRAPLTDIHLQTELQELIVEKISNTEVQRDLKASLHKITRGIEMSNKFIDMQLKSLQNDKLDTTSFEINSMKTLIESTLQEYPFTKKQLEIIKIKSNNQTFAVWIGEYVFKNLIWNLLKDAFDIYKQNSKGTFLIELIPGMEKDDYNYVHIECNIDLHNEELKNLKNFYFDKEGKARLSSSYCKMVMKAAGGEIYFNTKEDIAHFVLKFPKVD